MGVFQIFKYVQMAPNRAKHLIYLSMNMINKYLLIYKYIM